MGDSGEGPLLGGRMTHRVRLIRVREDGSGQDRVGMLCHQKEEVGVGK